MSSPTVTTNFVPQRATATELNGAVTINATATGSSPAPACSGLNPSTNWMYCDRKNSAPNIAKNTSVTATDAAENRGFLKNETSSIGSGVCSSHRMNAPSVTNPTTNAPTTTGAVH